MMQSQLNEQRLHYAGDIRVQRRLAKDRISDEFSKRLPAHKNPVQITINSSKDSNRLVDDKYFGTQYSEPLTPVRTPGLPDDAVIF